jgi:CRP-like cAMP-binding protein
MTNKEVRTMSDIKQTVTFLQRVPLFQGLNNRQLENLAKRVVEREFAAGQEIVQQGHGGEGFFVIVSGKAEAFRTRADGEKVAVNTFGPTDFFGELALLDDGLRTASVVASESVRCLALTRWDFLATLREDVEMSITILQELARRFRRALDAL